MNMSVLNFFEKNLYAKVALLTFAPIVILSIAFFGGNASGLPDMALGIWLLMVKFAMALIFLIMLLRANVLTLLNNWTFSGRAWMAILLFVVLFLPVILTVGFANLNNRPLAIVLLSHQSTGFFEEFQFRGVMMLGVAYALLKSGNNTPLLKTALITGVAFGGVHIINLLNGASIGNTVVQIISAGLVGVGFVYFVAIVRNIWLISIFHGVNNSLEFSDTYTFISKEYTMLAVALIVLVVMVLLYKKQDETTLVTALQDK